ncbi:MAG: GTPase Era [Mycoplasma sp.]|nr:GTPase Era [Mycoplasma sp.]
MKSGFVAILGRPNVGKSTLLNSIMNYKVSITSKVPQTTRDQIKGIYNDEDSQIIFIDTPGIHKPKQKLGEFLNSSSYKALKDIDAVLFLQPIDEEIGPGDKLIIEKIKNQKNKIALITKVDLETNPEKLQQRALKLKSYGFKLVLGASHKYKDSIKQIIKEIKLKLQKGEKYYDDEIITDKSISFISKEIIRESAIKYLKDELPHSIGVEILTFDESNPNKFLIEARIYCDRESQKGIIIGNKGSMIKKIGESARKNIAYYLNNKIHLDLKVKVNKKWTDSIEKIKKLGYTI